MFSRRNSICLSIVDNTVCIVVDGSVISGIENVDRASIHLFCDQTERVVLSYGLAVSDAVVKGVVKEEVCGVKVCGHLSVFCQVAIIIFCFGVSVCSKARYLFTQLRGKIVSTQIIFKLFTHDIPHIVAAVRVLPHLGQSLLKQVGYICNGSLGIYRPLVFIKRCFDQIGAQQCAVDRLRCAAVQSGEHRSRLCGRAPGTVYEVRSSGYCVVRTRKVVEMVFVTCHKQTKAFGVTVVEGFVSGVGAMGY